MGLKTKAYTYYNSIKWILDFCSINSSIEINRNGVYFEGVPDDIVFNISYGVQNSLLTYRYYTSLKKDGLVFTLKHKPKPVEIEEKDFISYLVSKSSYSNKKYSELVDTFAYLGIEMEICNNLASIMTRIGKKVHDIHSLIFGAKEFDVFSALDEIEHMIRYSPGSVEYENAKTHFERNS